MLRHFEAKYHTYYGNKPNYVITKTSDYNQLERIAARATNKAEKRISMILNNLQNLLNKPQQISHKKYQIHGFYDFKQISKRIAIMDEFKGYTLGYSFDKHIEKNTLSKIYGAEIDCCRECDSPMSFANIKEPVMYCFLVATIPTTIA